MTKEINSLVLAYLGDTIYEDYVRIYLIKNHICFIFSKILVSVILHESEEYFRILFLYIY